MDGTTIRQSAELEKNKALRVKGELQLTKEELCFAGTESFNIVLATVSGIHKAKGQPYIRIVTSTGARVLRFASVQLRDDFLAALNARKDAAVAAAGAQQQHAKVVPDAALQKAVFAAHPDLKDLHGRLVTTGHITEVEFWASKQRHVREVTAKQFKQPTGLSSMLLSLLAAAPDPATGKARIRLTKEVEQQIFKEVPAAAELYAATVPHVRTRAVFFDGFFKMLQKRVERRRKRAAGTLTANDELLTDFEEELIRYDAATAQRANAAKRRRLATADPTVNVAADQYDGFTGGYGLRCGYGETAVVGALMAGSADLADELNKHADVVLRGVGAGEHGGGIQQREGEEEHVPEVVSVEERARSGLSDLHAHKALEYDELRIKDTYNYFSHPSDLPTGQAQPSMAETSPGTDRVDASAAAEAVQHSLRGAGPLLGAVAAPDARAALAEEMADVQSDAVDASEEAGGRRADPAAALVPALLHGLKQQAITVNELLRHFWRCLPPSTRAKANKLGRVAQALEDLYKQCEAMQSAAQGMDRTYVSQLLRPLLGAMDRAFVQYDALPKPAQ